MKKAIGFLAVAAALYASVAGAATVSDVAEPPSGNVVLANLAVAAPNGGSAGPLVMDSAGALYGTSEYGGRYYRGFVFRLNPPKRPDGPWTKSVLHDFTDEEEGGPGSGVIIGPDGSLYGTTEADRGLVYRLSPPHHPDHHWSMTVLFDFRDLGAGRGGGPQGGVIIGSDGALYGTAGTSPNTNADMVFKLTPGRSSNERWQLTVLHMFYGDHEDGLQPQAGLTFGKNGELFGTTFYGGTGKCEVSYLPFSNGCGTVYMLRPPAVAGGQWTEKVIYRFSDAAGQGEHPNSALSLGPDGSLFGSAETGCSSSGCIAVFVLNAPSSDERSWTKTILYTIPNSSLRPITTAIDRRGAVFFIDEAGISKFTPSDGTEAGWAHSIVHGAKLLYKFPSGEGPAPGVVLARDGRLYASDGSVYLLDVGP